MRKENVIFVTTVSPSEVGHGGQHRSYQILFDLEEIVGRSQVLLFTKQQMLETMAGGRGSEEGSIQRRSRFSQWASHRAGSARRIARNPYRLIHRTQFATGIHPRIRNDYESEIKNLPKAVCVLEHAEFGDLIPINEKHGIPTVSCTQNIDAFSQNFELLSSYLSAIKARNRNGKQRAGFYAAILDFANELQILAKCDERLFISKLEAGLTTSLGLTAQYYPYVPRGAIRSRLVSIRRRRESTKKETGLFVLIGTAKHGPIKKSCEWFIENARARGLPAGVRIIVVGAGTDELVEPQDAVPGIELKGWIEQEEMDELLVRASAVLVPQRFGFGAPTRLAELSCAGIPVIGDQHPTYALDPPPGFSAMGSSWSDWQTKMEELSHGNECALEPDYLSWEAAQPAPLGPLVRKLLE
jgi:glycosyltransferase involved in cell wall biosynthesis